jgi:hypothetical protein
MGKRLLMLILLASQGIAQTPFIRDGSIGQARPKPVPGHNQLETLEIKDWVGQKFIFLPRSKKLKNYGYQAFQPSLPYEKWVGKVLTVVDVLTKSAVPEVTFQTSEGKKLRTRIIGEALDGLAPLRDLEYARSNWVGKTLWMRDNSLATWDEDREEFASLKLKKYAALQVEDVVAGWYHHQPIRLILKTPEGEIGFRDVNITGTNISKQLRKYRRFVDEFLEQDPKAGRNWPSDVWAAIENGRVVIGMTAEQARMSWGEPKSINRTVTARGAEEQWVYGNSGYIYIGEGKVTAIQN